MSAKHFNPRDFFARFTPLTLERILVTDYLLAHDILPSDLENLPEEKAAELFEEACHYAERRLNDIEPPIKLSSYSPVGFSSN